MADPAAARCSDHTLRTAALFIGRLAESGLKRLSRKQEAWQQVRGFESYIFRQTTSHEVTVIQLSDIRVEGSIYHISLAKLIGKPVVDIHGLLTNEFGDATFMLTSVQFADGTMLEVEGEHDLPYLVEGRHKQPNFDEETLNRLHEEDNT